MSHLVKVTLDVYVNDGITDAEAAEAVFDWSCQGAYEIGDENPVEAVDYIAGYDWTTAQT